MQRGDIQLLTCGEVAEVVEGAAQVQLGGVARQAPTVLAEAIGLHAEFLQGRHAAAVGHVAAEGDAQVAVAEQFAAVVEAGHVKHQAFCAGHAVAGFEGQVLGACVSEAFIELHTPEAIDSTEGPVGGAQAIDVALAAAEAGGFDAEQAAAGVLQLTGLVVQVPGVEAEGLATKLKNALLVAHLPAEVEAAAGASQAAYLPACAVVEIAAAEGQTLAGFDQAATVGERVASRQVQSVAADLAIGAVIKGGTVEG